MKHLYEFLKLFSGTVKLFYSAFFIISACLVQNVYSQSNFNLNEIKTGTEKLNLRNSSAQYNFRDTIQKKSKPFQMKKSPWKAVLYSAVVPGLGQFYNESYWKIPIIAGLGGYFIYEYVKNNNTYQDYKEQYANSQTPQNPAGNPTLKSLREFYRDQRDDFIIYFSILYVVNLLDAYVDAQLFDFDVSDKIKLGLIQKDKLIKLSYAF